MPDTKQRDLKKVLRATTKAASGFTMFEAFPTANHRERGSGSRVQC